jgi:hypothetical protein
MSMKYDKHFMITSCISVFNLDYQFLLSRYKFCETDHIMHPSDSDVPKECLASDLASTVCSTKQSSFQMLKFSHWLKCEFAIPNRPNFTF